MTVNPTTQICQRQEEQGMQPSREVKRDPRQGEYSGNIQITYGRSAASDWLGGNHEMTELRNDLAIVHVYRTGSRTTVRLAGKLSIILPNIHH
eukprot:1183827-Prorocentrum_minimum.AAC.2